jgi:phage gp36-like protein
MAADITRAELASLGLRSAALTGISTGDQDAACESATSTARSYLRARYPTAGAITDPGYKQAVARIAAHELLSTRGFDPSGSRSDEAVQINRDAAVRWLRDVSNGVAHLDITETIAETFAVVLAGDLGITSDEPRGW